MTVGDLIDLLMKHDPKRLVVLQKDAEGNGFSPCSGMWPGAYVAETTWYGEVHLDELTEEDRADGFDECDLAPEGAEPCLVLRPVN